MKDINSKLQTFPLPSSPPQPVTKHSSTCCGFDLKFFHFSGPLYDFSLVLLLLLSFVSFHISIFSLCLHMKPTSTVQIELSRESMFGTLRPQTRLWRFGSSPIYSTSWLLCWCDDYHARQFCGVSDLFVSICTWLKDRNYQYLVSKDETERQKNNERKKLDVVQLCETQEVRLFHVMVGLLGLCGWWGSGQCNGSVDSGCHEVSENIWFEYCRMS